MGGEDGGRVGAGEDGEEADGVAPERGFVGGADVGDGGDEGGEGGGGEVAGEGGELGGGEGFGVAVGEFGEEVVHAVAGGVRREGVRSCRHCCGREKVGSFFEKRGIELKDVIEDRGSWTHGVVG